MPFCPQCNIEVDEQDKFCRGCGVELKKEEDIINSSDTKPKYDRESDIPLINRSRWYQRFWFGIGITTGIVLISLGTPPSAYEKVAFLTTGVALLAAMLVWFKSLHKRKQERT